MNNRLPLRTLTVLSFALLAHALPAMGRPMFYCRDDILAGQIWRLFTCHWPHLSNSHLLWNSAAFLVAGCFLERTAPRNWSVTFATTIVLIGPGLLALEPQMAMYAGLSGPVSALVTALAFNQLSAGVQPVWLWRTLLFVTCMKVGIEVIQPTPIFATFESTAVQSVPTAHALGIAAGGISHFLVTRFATGSCRRGVQPCCSPCFETTRSHNVCPAPRR